MYKMQMEYFLHIMLLHVHSCTTYEGFFCKSLSLKTPQSYISRILKDLFISSIHLSWSWTIFNFFASFVCSWAFFAVIWYLIALIHGKGILYHQIPTVLYRVSYSPDHWMSVSTKDGHAPLFFRCAYPHICCCWRIFPHPHGHP